jgi:hypothetical protein
VAGGCLQLRAQHTVHVLRLLGRGRAAGADGPHGFVGDDDLAGAMRQLVDHRGQLALDHGFGLAGLALGQRLADADDGRDALGQRSLGLLGHQQVAFGV